MLDEKIANLQRRLALDPDDIATVLKLERYYRIGGNADEALELLTGHLIKHPESAALRKAFRLLRQSGGFDETLEDLTDQLIENGGRADIRETFRALRHQLGEIDRPEDARTVPLSVLAAEEPRFLNSYEKDLGAYAYENEGTAPKEAITKGMHSLSSWLTTRIDTMNEEEGEYRDEVAREVVQFSDFIEYKIEVEGPAAFSPFFDRLEDETEQLREILGPATIQAWDEHTAANELTARRFPMDQPFGVMAEEVIADFERQLDGPLGDESAILALAQRHRDLGNEQEEFQTLTEYLFIGPDSAMVRRKFRELRQLRGETNRPENAQRVDLEVLASEIEANREDYDDELAPHGGEANAPPEDVRSFYWGVICRLNALSSSYEDGSLRDDYIHEIISTFDYFEYKIEVEGARGLVTFLDFLRLQVARLKPYVGPALRQAWDAHETALAQGIPDDFSE